MIGRQVLEAAMPEHDITDEQADKAERLILAYATQTSKDLEHRVEELLGRRLVEALADPNAPAAIINAAMKWLENRKPGNDQPKDNPMAGAIEAAAQACKEGGKLPDIDDYAEDPA